jgi:hypothetical protein
MKRLTRDQQSDLTEILTHTINQTFKQGLTPIQDDHLRALRAANILQNIDPELSQSYFDVLSRLGTPDMQDVVALEESRAIVQTLDHAFQARVTELRTRQVERRLGRERPIPPELQELVEETPPQ